MRRRFGTAMDEVVDSPAALTIVFVLLVAMLAIGARGWHASVEFYATIAQVIPVLLLAATVEGRMFRSRRNHTRFQARAMRASLLLVGVGEGSALIVVAQGHDSLALRTGTTLGLLVVVAAFLVYALDGPAPPDESRPGSEDEPA